jgi:hypothetical protein
MKPCSKSPRWDISVKVSFTLKCYYLYSYLIDVVGTRFLKDASLKQTPTNVYLIGTEGINTSKVCIDISFCNISRVLRSSNWWSKIIRRTYKPDQRECYFVIHSNAHTYWFEYYPLAWISVYKTQKGADYPPKRKGKEELRKVPVLSSATTHPSIDGWTLLQVGRPS